MGSICLYMLIQKKVDEKLVNPTSVHWEKIAPKFRSIFMKYLFRRYTLEN